MAKERIDVEGGKTYGPYSPGVKANGVIWLAGQIAPEAGDDTASQTAASLEKIDSLLIPLGFKELKFHPQELHLRYQPYHAVLKWKLLFKPLIVTAASTANRATFSKRGGGRDYGEGRVAVGS